MTLALRVFGLAACLAGCQLPSVTLRMRARFDRSPERSARTLEGRVDCSWAFERAAGTRRAEVDEPASQRAYEPSPCTQADACAWETENREAALAIFAPRAELNPGDAR